MVVLRLVGIGDELAAAGGADGCCADDRGAVADVEGRRPELEPAGGIEFGFTATGT